MAEKVNKYFDMKKGEIALTSFPQNEVNPFLKQTVEEVNNHVVKKWKSNVGGTSRNAILTAVNSEGEPVGQTTFVRQQKVDEERFTKLYLDHFQSFFNLSQAGLRVFGYIMQCMKPSKDSVGFSFKECMKYTDYKSRASVYKGLTELLSAGIIARSEEDWKYFINPLIMWNGNRVTFVEDYVKANDNARQLESDAKSARNKRIAMQAQAREWKINEEVFFNSDEGREPARIIDINIESGDVTLLLYKTNKTVIIGASSDNIIRREQTLPNMG